MSEKINPEDQDSNEPIRHSHYSSGVPTGREYEHLYNRVDKMDEKVDGLCADMKVVKGYIEDEKEKEKKNLTKAGILAGIISAIIGIIIRVWHN